MLAGASRSPLPYLEKRDVLVPGTAPFALSGRFWIVVILATAAAFAPVAVPYLSAGFNGIDFEAFYCAGRTIAQHGDPYLQQPLQHCEDDVYWSTRPDWRRAKSDVVVPAPQPAAAFLPFEALSFLPYAWAHVVWTIGLLVAGGLSALMVSRLFLVPLVPTIWTIALGMTMSLTLGQTVPWCLLAICLCAYAVRARRPALVALATIVLFAQPSVLVAVVVAVVCLGTFAERIAACAGCVIGLALCALAVGWNTVVEYATVILPVHESAELVNRQQFSLSAMLFQMGVSEKIALVAGSLSFVAAVIAAVVASRRWLREDRAMLAIVPPAFAVFLGSFAHLQLYLLALPLALVVATRAQTQLARVALITLTIPWQWIVLSAYLIADAAIVLCASLRLWIFPSMRQALVVGLGAAAVLAFVTLNYVENVPEVLPHVTFHALPHASAEPIWVALERFAAVIYNGPGVTATRAVSIAALAVILWLAFTPRTSARAHA